MSQSKLRMARCRTEGCYMHNFVIDLDSPQSVAAWNTRSNDLAQAEVKLAKAVAFIEDLTGHEWPIDVQAKRILAAIREGKE